MATPIVSGISIKTLTCKRYNLIRIEGSNFTKDVTVDLAETLTSPPHEWFPSTGKWRANASGTVIEISAKPQNADGTDCSDDSDHTIGDLTVTVTNSDGTPSTPNAIAVKYSL